MLPLRQMAAPPSRRARSNDLIDIRRSSASRHRHRVRDHHCGRSRRDANSRGAISGYRSAAGHGHRCVSGRIGVGGGIERGAAPGGAGRRRRSRTLYEVDQRQRRQLHAHRFVCSRHQSRHQHRQRQQPRPDRAVATAARGAAAGSGGAEKVVCGVAVHRAL